MAARGQDRRRRARPAAGGERARSRKRAAHLGPERRRPQVLDAALELFLERGYEGTSMEAIARAAGVTKPVVYACFPGKAELFRELLDREERGVIAEIEAAFAGVDLDDPRTTLTGALTGFLRAVAASPEVYRIVFLGQGGGNAAIAARIQRGRDAQIAALAALAGPWLERSRGSDGDLDRSARLLGAAVVGLAEAGARMLLSEPVDWDPDELGGRLGQIAAGALAAI